MTVPVTHLEIDDVWFDGTLTQTIVYHTLVTDFPTEEDNISDNYILTGRSVQIEALVSEYPIEEPMSHAGDRVFGTYQAIQEIINQHKLVNVIVGLDVLRNCALENPRFDLTGAGRAYKFTCTAREVKIATTKEASVPKPVVAKKKSDKGQVNATPATDAQAAKAKQSLAKYVLGGG
jgi:hypothetical protein